MRNEADNVAPVIAEIVAALDGRWNYEIVYVNDGSTDATADRLAAAMKERANLRRIDHARSTGQSAAVRSGVRAARGAIVATIDGDGQNNPAFLPDLISAVQNGGERVGLFCRRWDRLRRRRCRSPRPRARPSGTGARPSRGRRVRA